MASDLACEPVVDRDRKRDLVVVLRTGSAKHLLQMFTADTKEPECGRVSLTNVLDDVQPEDVRIRPCLFYLTNLQPEVGIACRPTIGLDLDDAARAC